MTTKQASSAQKQLFIDTIGPLLDSMFRTAVRFMRDRDDAQDAVQEALHKGWRGLNKFQPGQSMKPWLFQILANTCIDQLRARRRMDESRVVCDVETLESTSRRKGYLSPEESLSDLNVLNTIEHAVQRLPLAQQVVVHLVIAEQMSYEEAAQALDLPIGTVRSRLSRARTQLCAALSDVGETPVKPTGNRPDNLKLVVR